MTGFLSAHGPAWAATVALVLILAENALGVTGLSLFLRDRAGRRDPG